MQSSPGAFMKSMMFIAALSLTTFAHGAAQFRHESLSDRGRKVTLVAPYVHDVVLGQDKESSAHFGFLDDYHLSDITTHNKDRKNLAMGVCKLNGFDGASDWSFERMGLGFKEDNEILLSLPSAAGDYRGIVALELEGSKSLVNSFDAIYYLTSVTCKK